METYRIINPKKPHRKYFKTEEWIRKYAHTMRLHSLFFSDQKEITTDFNLFLKEKGILLQSVEKPVETEKKEVYESKFDKRLKEQEEKRLKLKEERLEKEQKERVPVDDEQPEEQKEETQIDFSSMTIKQLRDYAKDNDISLGSLRKKSAIIEAIINN